VALAFPWAEPPAPGTRRRIAPGIDWVYQPLPFRLDHVNCWWLQDETGATVQIDTGVASDATRAHWRDATGADPDTLLITHFHPDHAGCAGEYAARGVRLLGSEVEMRLASAIHAMPDEAYGELYAAWYARHGLSEEVIDKARRFGNGYRMLVSSTAPPETVDWLAEGDSVVLGGRRWQVLIGRGHAPAMLMLHDAEAGLLIGADQVLPTISPNVSAGPSPGSGHPPPFGLDEPDPLARFLETLDALRVLPTDTLVLPSHGLPFRGLHERLDALCEHHEDRLRAVRDACDEPRTASDLFAVLFGRRMDAQQMSFALGEALAHADHLVGRGELVREDSETLTTFVRR